MGLFIPFGHIFGKISDKLICQAIAAMIFRTRGHEKLGKLNFYYCLKWLKFVEEYRKTIVDHKSLVSYQ